MKYLFSTLFSICSLLAIGQNAPNFQITDTDGVAHDLYIDHLDQGQTVVIKLFFTTCPPCISLADDMEALYQQWGAGDADVEFFEFSILNSDTNEKVRNFKNTYGVTFVGAGSDGGGKDAATPYQSGQYGNYTGTPTFIVIAPDGTLEMGFQFSQLNDKIAATGATGMNNGGGPDPTTFDLSINTQSTTQPSTIEYLLRSADNPDLTYNISELTGGSLSFEYPSVDFPEMTNPEIIVNVDGPIIDNSVKPTDLVRLRKHLLELESFNEEYQFIAADINGDGILNPLDLLNLQKALLELITEFPNGTPSWISIPHKIALDTNPGTNVTVDFQIVKVGNMN